MWISLTHRYAPLPPTSKQLKLKVGEKVMGGGGRAQGSDFKRERKLRPEEWDRASWNSRLMQRQDWFRFILLQKYSVQRPCDEFLQPPGKERLSFALMFFTDYTLQLLWFSGENRRTLWRNGSVSDSSSEGCVFKSRQGQCLLVQVLSLPAQWSVFLIKTSKTDAANQTKWMSCLLCMV